MDGLFRKFFVIFFGSVILFLGQIGGVYLNQPVSAIPKLESGFADVSENHQNYNAIQYLKERGIIHGYPDGSFRPDKEINRAELLKILVEGNGFSPNVQEYKNCFSDVQEQWFAPYVCYAKDKNWVEGYSLGDFKPEQTVNKAESLKMLLNAQGVAIPISVDEDFGFQDTSKYQWFMPFVDRSLELGVLNSEDELLNLGKKMTRGEVSNYLYEILFFKEDLDQAGDKLFLQTENDQVYVLDSQTKSLENPFPAEYNLLSPSFGPGNEDYWFLEKEGEVFVYDLENNDLTDLSLPITLDENYIFNYDPSVNEIGKFFITVIETDKTPSLYGYVKVNVREFFYDLETKELLELKDPFIDDLTDDFGHCVFYDSLNNRIFYHRCGEGIGSRGPLMYYDLATQASFEYPLLASYDQWDNDIKMNQKKLFTYRDGELLVLDLESNLDGQFESFKFEESNDDRVFSEEDASIYSFNYVPEHNLILIGRAQDLLIYQYDQDSSELVDQKIIDVPGGYLNFIVASEDKVYFSIASSDLNIEVWVLDLETAIVQEKIRLDSEGSWNRILGLY